MPYALELALDDSAAGAVPRAWETLADAGITYMARSGARPHVSLGIWDAIDRVAFEAELARFAAETAPLPITLASVGRFSADVVYLAPAVTAPLLDVHADAHRRLARYGTAPWRHYDPGAWVPHCTLALEVTGQQLETALRIAGRVPLPLQSRLVEVGIVEFRPVRQLASRALGGG
jgi:2'-5' RNA ligase